MDLRNSRRKRGAHVELKYPPTGSVEEQNRILEDLANQNYSGVALSVIAPNDQIREIDQAAERMIIRQARRVSRMGLLGDLTRRRCGKAAAAMIRTSLWDMSNPMAPVLKQQLHLRSGHGSHWLTFDIDGNYAYVAPGKNSEQATEIFDARTHVSIGTIKSSEDMLEIDFAGGKISRVGDQYGIGPVQRRIS